MVSPRPKETSITRRRHCQHPILVRNKSTRMRTQMTHLPPAMSDAQVGAIGQKWIIVTGLVEVETPPPMTSQDRHPWDLTTSRQSVAAKAKPASQKPMLPPCPDPVPEIPDRPRTEIPRTGMPARPRFCLAKRAPSSNLACHLTK